MRLFCLLVAFGVGCTAASAEDDFVASLRLRGGFDTNPQFSNGGIGGSAFIGTHTALAAGTKGEGYSYGVAAEAGTTQYANPLAIPALTGKVILRANYGDESANVASTTTISDTNTYNLRSSDLIQSVKGEVVGDNLKVFATVEGARSSLNQTNGIFQDFLPNPQVYLRGTFIPGMSYVRDKLEIGMSVNLSARRYDREFDDFGYRRDNERVQPFLFAKYEDKDVTLFGAVSRLHATFHDVDFTNVDAILFDAKLTWRINPVTLDLAAYRRAGETTFPISPITLDTVYTAKASWLVEPRLTLSAAVGYATTDYLDSSFSAQTLTYGVGASHDLGGGYALGIDLTRAQGVLISGDKASAVIISSSLTKKFTPLEKDTSKDSKDKKTVTKG
jgi:hypothetical protein